MNNNVNKKFVFKIWKIVKYVMVFIFVIENTIIALNY